MAQILEQELKELGSKLERPPSSRDAVVELLKDAASCLSELDQTPLRSTKKAMQPLMNAIAKATLLKHEDDEVKLFVASCACEITRITAPEAPYEDEILKDLFKLIVSTLSGLNDIKGPSFGRRVRVLETLATYRSCVLMLDLECDDLIDEMFNTLFSVVSDEHPENVLNLIQSNMEVLLEESEDVSENCLLVLLATIGRNKKEVTMAGTRLAMNVIKGCAARLEPGIKRFFMSLMSGDSKPMKFEINYHRALYHICCCAPQILSDVIPYLRGELLSDQLDMRLQTVSLVGGLFALPGFTISEAFKPVLSEFLGRLTDRDMVVRMSVLEYVKNCLLENPFRVEAQLMISALCDQLMGNDENVRKQVVSVVCDVACHTLTCIPVETIKMVAECLQDKSLLVKSYTMKRLGDIHRISCMKQSNGGTDAGKYDWIVGKLLRCFYDSDFRSDTTEPILSLSLFPDYFSVKDKVTNWIRVFSRFDKVQVRALEKMLEQKQRLQQEMQTYISIRQLSQEGGGTEIQEKVKSCFSVMSRCFCYPLKAEDEFQTLDQLKDPNVWKILMQLIDPNTSSLQAINIQDELLNILGQEHQLYEFLRILSIKCSYSLFDKDHVRELLLEAGVHKSSGDTEAVLSCMTILVILAQSSSLLFGGIEEDLVHLLEDDNEIIKECTLHILMKAGGIIQETLDVSLRSLELALEHICIEGSRWQAKHAVRALAAITKKDDLMSLSVLYKRLIDMLEEKLNLPAVLQALGCIAEVAMPVFGTRESEVEEFIKQKILKRRYIAGKKAVGWDDRSELCSLKIFGLKCLVKSYLPVKNAHLGCGIDGMIRILKTILLFGDISRDTNLSLVDRAHLKLAAAKAVLRLSKHWENKIPVDVLYLALQTSEVNLPEVRKLLLKKVHQYVTDQILDPKYTCAFLLDVSSSPSDLEEYNFYLNDIIQMCRQGRGHQVPLQTDLISPSLYPDYILPYVVHSLAHHPSFPSIDECKDIKTFESMYRQLYLFLSMLVTAVGNGKSDVNINKDMGSISLLTSIFHHIRFSEDVVDASKSKNSHALCHLGMRILNLLAPNRDNLHDLSATVALPSMLYNSLQNKGENDLLVGEDKTLLADEGILAHFESLEQEANRIVQSVIPEDEVMMDSETEGSDMPLEKLMKRLKAENIKREKERYEPAQAVLANENDFEILEMDEEIKSDDLGTARKFDNGKVYTRRKRSGHDLQKSKMLIGGSTDASVPKHRRPRMSQDEKCPSEINSMGSERRTSVNEKNIASKSDKRDEKGQTSFDSDYVPKETGEASSFQTHTSCTRKRKRSSSSLKPKGARSVHNRMTSKNSLEAKKLKKGSDSDSTCSKSSPQSGSEENKPKTATGLHKPKSKDNGGPAKELVGCRIKVWWPLDKRYYDGIVESYNTWQKKHRILYDDGGVEKLHLGGEWWKLVDEDWKAKDAHSTTGSSKEESSGKEKKSGGGSKLDEKLAQKFPSYKKKRTPRRILRQEPKTPSKSKSFKKSSGSPDIPFTDPTSQSSCAGSNSEKEMNKNTENGEQQLDKDCKQEECVMATSDAESPEDEKKESEHTDEYDVAISPCKTSGSDSEATYSSIEAEENEPLSMWMQRTRKT